MDAAQGRGLSQVSLVIPKHEFDPHEGLKIVNVKYTMKKLFATFKLHLSTTDKIF